MTKLKVLTTPSRTLRKKSQSLKAAEVKTERVRQLVADIRETISAGEYGVGMSAVQVGEPLAVSVVMIRPTPNRPDLKPFNRTYFNAEVTDTEGGKTPMWEGCCSVVGDDDKPVYAQVPRYPKIQVKYLDENGETFIEVKSRPHKNITLAKIKGVDTIELAERLRGKIVYINRADVNLADGVNFVQDLIGLDVIDADSGENYGKITDVLRTGANDVYEITDSNGRKYLAPVIDEVVISRNIDEGFVLIRPMKGIFDDED